MQARFSSSSRRLQRTVTVTDLNPTKGHRDSETDASRANHSGCRAAPAVGLGAPWQPGLENSNAVTVFSGSPVADTCGLRVCQ